MLINPIKKSSNITTNIIFDNNDHAAAAFGPSETHLKLIQDKLSVIIKCCGNELTIQGESSAVEKAKKSLSFLYQQACDGETIDQQATSDCLRFIEQDQNTNFQTLLQKHTIVFPKKKIMPRTKGQVHYIDAINTHDIVIGIGPAGTGKTYLAMAVGMTKLLKGEVERLILTRPAVEAGERLGFLPGDLADKVNPYLRPLYDALHDMVDYERAARMITVGQIEIAPIAFMRGRTLGNSYVILDEAQNCTREQMKMFLTRMGANSQAVITGDITQIDLPRTTKSGLLQAMTLLSHIKGIAIHKFSDQDVVRHALVADIIRAYERSETK